MTSSIREAITLFATEQSLLAPEERILVTRCGCVLRTQYIKNARGIWLVKYTQRVSRGVCMTACKYTFDRGRFITEVLTGRMVKRLAPHLFKKQK